MAPASQAPANSSTCVGWWDGYGAGTSLEVNPVVMGGAMWVSAIPDG